MRRFLTEQVIIGKRITGASDLRFGKNFKYLPSKFEILLPRDFTIQW